MCAMPNTDPPLDDPASVGWVLAEGKRAGAARVYPTGCISVDRAGERLAPVGEMIDAGAVAVTDDGSPIMKSGLMRLALEYAQSFGIPVADHPEDLSLSPAGQMNEGLMSTRMGLVGKPTPPKTSTSFAISSSRSLQGGTSIFSTSPRAGVLTRSVRRRPVVYM